MSMRGEPEIEDVIDAIAVVWHQVPDMPFSRLMAQLLTCAGAPQSRWDEALGGVGMRDSELMRGIESYQRILRNS